MKNNLASLVSALGSDRVLPQVKLAAKTYFRIGGPADYYFEAKSTDEIIKAIKAIRQINLPYYVIGLGANLLVGDQGFRGLVIKIANNNMEIVGPYRLSRAAPTKETEHYRPFDTKKYLKFDDLEMPERAPDTLIRVGAGVPLPVLINWTLARGLTGLQSFAGIPSTVGGCIYNNVHGGTKLFDQFVDRVTLLGKDGELTEASGDEMGFAYDYSRLQKTGEIITEVYLKLAHGDIARAREVREEWLKRKLIVQPQINCSGCIFKNLTPEEAARIGSPTVSTGWVLDVGLGMKGTRIGGIEVSKKHANFFVNTGKGTAAEVLALIKLAKEKAKEKFNLDLIEEIQKVGEF